MTFTKNIHIYFASPFFSSAQKDLCDFVESLETNKVPIYSPRKDGFVLTPTATQSERESVFNSNVDAINECSFILAVIDDYDPGTIWEMGYAHGIGKPCVAYSDVSGRTLNVMLAGSAKEGFINGRSKLEDFFCAYLLINHLAFPRNTWEGKIQ